MSLITIKLPDVGEGVAEAELVEWCVQPGEQVKEDQMLAAVMTDKATVEIPSPVAGKVVWLGGEVGQHLAVGCDLLRIETGGVAEETGASRSPPHETAPTDATPISGHSPASAAKLLASPAVRQRARSTGIDLALVQGSGPEGRITQHDLERHAAKTAPPLAGVAACPDTACHDSVRVVKIVGLRRKIAERMANAARRIPHITLIEEVDMTDVEALRAQLNETREGNRPKLTLLPFLMMAIVHAVRQQPALNAHFDDENEVTHEFASVHIGIATQTKGGLLVPVIRHCENRALWDCADELARVVAAARGGAATREDLSGSTITLSSLGALGAVAATPIINHPEVAIIGVNRMDIRPKWDGAAFVPRKMMNLSSSFDHRVIDGWDAALFIKRLKDWLETPALFSAQEGR